MISGSKLAILQVFDSPLTNQKRNHLTIKKMKKLIYGVSFLALVGIIVFGCQKENVNPTLSTTNQSVEQKGTGKVDPIEFGRLHNEYLIAAIENSIMTKV